EALRSTYGGPFSLRDECIYANFVASIDGVVALRAKEESGHIISGGNEADRFVMGLLRACADAVLLGAGTFRKAAGHLWHAETIYPPAAPQFAELRCRLGRKSPPPLVVVTATGEIDPAQPALRDAVIVTTPAGEARLKGRVPATARIEAGAIRLQEIIARLHSTGHRRILTEGGPTLASELAAAGLLDELFLTQSPKLFGRTSGDGRKGLIDGVDLGGRTMDLISVRRYGSFLFLRYSLPR
ncbi:MAG TPA: dihydrofolate reductase family protein, partial [Myxococcales bacterium]|nr:dihydrofolate reductase family protein [Myxococcales bacterium]